MMTRIAAALLALSAAACALPPQQASVALPPDPALGLADPGRGAILNASYAFATRSRLAGRPADAAIALAQAEFLAVDLETNQRWREFSPVVPLGFQGARAEWRAAAGIAADAQPQAVINALTTARAWLVGGDAARAAAALPAPLFQGGGNAALARLAALPALPRTADAARSAETALMEMQDNINE
ncbi:MAG TPA: hypothetical protein VGM87_15620 [Roseomonas sp.]|jgi:hypothetical protein